MVSGVDMKLSTAFLAFALTLGVTACSTTPEKTELNRRAELEKIESELNSALASNENGYGKYLTLLNAKSASLVELAALPTASPSGDTRLDIQNLVVSISAGALLSDLPRPNDTIKIAIRNSQASENALNTACETTRTSDCALGETLLETMPARAVAAEALALSVSTEDAWTTSKQMLRTYRKFTTSLPVRIPTFSMDMPDAGAMIFYADVRQQACTLSWAQSLIAPKLDRRAVSSVTSAYQVAMARAFKRTKVNFCLAGPTNCTSAEIKCVRGVEKTKSCQFKEVAALERSCGPVANDLADVVSNLITDDHTGT